MDALLQKFTKIEEAFEAAGFNRLAKKVDDIESKQTVAEIALDDKLKVFSTETDSKIVSCELRSEEKIKELGDKCSEAIDKALAIEIRLKDLSKEWPTPMEGWTQVASKRNEKKLNQAAKPIVTFAEKFKAKPKDTIVLVGDSLTLGVGAKLAMQSNMVSTICRPGSHIEDITLEVGKLDDKEDRHLVLLVGTNEIMSEGSVGILSKYSTLIDVSRKLKNRKVSVVGIPRRADLSSFHNSRRIGVNMQLREKCEAVNVEFIDYEPADNRLARDGLHLNHLGQDELGRKIFQHCRRFLV